MTKRRCPWPIETCLQLKSHIGLREMANGVNGRSFTDMIQEYTTNLLLKGAKTVYTKPNAKQMDTTEPGNYNICDHSQTTIPSYFLTTSKMKHCVLNKGATSMSCQHCNSATIECSFCSKPTCSACMRACSMCNHFFCSTCSILQYDSHSDKAICFGCIT